MQYYKMQQLFYDDIKQSVFVKCVGSFTIKMQEFHCRMQQILQNAMI